MKAEVDEADLASLSEEKIIKKLARLNEINEEISKIPRFRWDVALLMERTILLFDLGLYRPQGP